MKSALRIALAVMCLSLGVVWAQQSGTVNSLSVNPRQNQELTNSTGTESGQPSDAVPGSESQDDGLVPVTSNMAGSDSNSNTNQSSTANKPATAASANQPVNQSSQARKNPNENATSDIKK